MIYYDREFPVAKWVMGMNLTEKQQELFNKAVSKKAIFVHWPGLDMPEELKKLAREGYAEQINQSKPFFLDLVLALRAMINITRKYNPTAQLSNKPQYHHLCNNRITNDSDLIRLANEILAANDSITLSQIFDTAEKTENILASLNGDKKTVQKIAKEVTVIGNGNEFDVDLSNLTGKELQTAISSAF